ncbi:cytochrome P450 [Streptomyces sp. NPDC001076]
MTTHDMDLLGPIPEALRSATGGVASIVTPAGDRMWLVRDYALSRFVLTDRRFSRSDAVAAQAPKLLDAEPVPESIMSMDGEEHARLRRTTAGAFTTHRIAAMAPFIERLTDELLDRMAVSEAPVDFVSTVAAHLPLTVLCALLGVPEEDSDRFKGWVEVLFDIASGPETQYRRRLELARYITRLLGDKRRDPQEDLLSTLLGEQEAGRLSKTETLTMGLTLLMAGFQSTIGQIGLMVLSILSDPPTAAQLRERPELVPHAVEEAMRLNPASLISFPRIALEPVRLGDVVVGTGEAVIVSFLDANRDGKVFEDPMRPALEDRNPGHIAFGHGAHRCLGAPLATLQLRIVLTRLLHRFPTLRLAAVPEPVTWKEGLATRGLSRLMVAWDTERTGEGAR